LEFSLPSQNISVVDCGGDGRIPSFFNQLLTLFPNFHKSPYRTRTLIVLDAANSVKDSAFTRSGIPSSNIVRLEKNGIEYYYPRELLQEAFGVALIKDSDIILKDERIIVGDISKKKIEVAEEVADRLKAYDQLHEELSLKILKSVTLMIGPRRILEAVGEEL
jgi:hypothetical protein